MFSVAWPEASSAALPRLVAPSKKVTVPLGVPAAGATATTLDGDPVPFALDKADRVKLVVAATPELHGEIRSALLATV